MRTAMKKLLLMSGGGLHYLIREPFNSKDTSLWTYVENDGTITVSSGLATFTVQATPVWGDLGFHHNAGISRVPGVALLAKVTLTNTSNEVGWGWNNSAAVQSFVNYEYAVRFIVTSEFLSWYRGGANIGLAAAGFSVGTELRVAQVLRSVGVANYYKTDTSTKWILGWIYRTASTATLYPAFSNNTVTGNFDTVNVIKYAPSLFVPPVDISGSLAADRGSVSPGTDPAMPNQDTFIQVIATTVPSAGSITVDIRIQDSSNYWQIEINSSGDYRLNEVVAGTPTNRINAAAAVTDGELLTILVFDSTIELYSDTTKDGSYASASNFATETDWTVSSLGTGGALDDLEAHLIFLPSSTLIGAQLDAGVV